MPGMCQAMSYHDPNITAYPHGMENSISPNNSQMGLTAPNIHPKDIDEISINMW